MIVRRGRPGDAGPVLALVEQLGYTPDSRGYDETFAQVARHPEAAVFVAAEGLRINGYLAMSHRPLIRLGGRAAFIDELVVDERRRNEGVGTALLESALQHARGLGVRRVEISCTRSRTSYKRGFYLTNGFHEVDSALFRLELSPIKK
jgi:GNAT superfamily N-acetyltransferase